MTILPALALLTFASTIVTASSSVPLPPSRDPFYTAPDNFENASPGDVLRVRIAPGDLTSFVANTSQAYNILFRTTDSHYQPFWAVTTLFIPDARLKSTGDALLSYQYAYNSPNIDESPSFAFHGGLNPSNSVLFTDVEWALGRGYYVAVPDFEGPKATFIAGVQEGHATLDSIRAVRSLSLGLKPDARTALSGYSGGAFASEYAAELQVQYAPELQIAGVALGGLVDNGTRAVDAVNGAPYAGLIPLGLLGLTAQYPEARAYVLDQLHDSGPFNETTFLSSFNLTLVQIFGIFANQTVYKYFKDGRDILYNPTLSKILSIESTLGSHGVPQAPLFIYKAVHDEVTSIEGANELVERYCEYGANIWYQRNTVGDHVEEHENGKARTFQFLQDVLEGNYSHHGCTVETVTVNVATNA